MEVRIGVQHANRELTLDSGQTGEEVQELVAKALTGDERMLVLVDERGRRLVVPTDKLAYVEIGEESTRRVGFGAEGS